MSSEAPTMLGKYRILDLLGEGGMGIVYQAEDTVLMRRVAIKVMTEAIARQSDLRDRFLREARAAGSLQHPNVVTVYDFGEVDVHLVIAMELVDGSDLEHLLTRKDPLRLDAKLSVVIDLLRRPATAEGRRPRAGVEPTRDLIEGAPARVLRRPVASTATDRGCRRPRRMPARRRRRRSRARRGAAAGSAGR